MPRVHAASRRRPEAAAGERRKWAEGELAELEAKREEALGAALGRDGRREVRFERGELRLLVGGEPVLERIFLDDGQGRLAEAYWRWLLLSGSPRDGKAFAADLRRPPNASGAPAAAQFIERVCDLAAAVSALETAEKEMNETLYRLYRLTTDERNLVESERARRGGGPATGPIG